MDDNLIRFVRHLEFVEPVVHMIDPVIMPNWLAAGRNKGRPVGGLLLYSKASSIRPLRFDPYAAAAEPCPFKSATLNCYPG
jgi:hypothetical protein